MVMRIGKDLTPGTNAEIFTKLTRGTTHLQFHLREPIHKAELSVIAEITSRPSLRNQTYDHKNGSHFRQGSVTLHFGSP